MSVPQHPRRVNLVKACRPGLAGAGPGDQQLRGTEDRVQRPRAIVHGRVDGRAAVGWPAEGLRRHPQEDEERLHRGGVGNPEERRLSQSVRGQLADPAPGRACRGPGVDGAVHAVAAGHEEDHRRAGQGGGPDRLLQLLAHRHAAEGRRVRRRRVRQDRGRHADRRQPRQLDLRQERQRRGLRRLASATSRASARSKGSTRSFAAGTRPSSRR